jgi:hypothetical protein
MGARRKRCGRAGAGRVGFGGIWEGDCCNAAVMRYFCHDMDMDGEVLRTVRRYARYDTECEQVLKVLYGMYCAWYGVKGRCRVMSRGYMDTGAVLYGRAMYHRPLARSARAASSADSAPVLEFLFKHSVPSLCVLPAKGTFDPCLGCLWWRYKLSPAEVLCYMVALARSNFHLSTTVRPLNTESRSVTILTRTGPH